MPGAASAAEVRAGDLASGPVLAGSRVVWTDGGVRRALTVRTAPVSGGLATTIASRAPNPSGQYGRLAASPTVVALELFSGAGDPQLSFRSVFAGGLNGPLQPLEKGCKVSFPFPRTIDVSGDDVLYVGCDEREGILRDMQTGGTRPVPSGTRGLRVAGRFAAWVDGSPARRDESIVVYDLGSEKISYTIPAASLPFGLVDDLDLQADGKIAVAYPSNASAHVPGLDRVGWAAPDAPSLHVSALRAAQSYKIKFAGDRIAFDRSAATEDARIRSQVGVSDLAGHVKLFDTGGDDDTIDDEHFDFDGQRVAWFSNGCHQAIVHVRVASSSATMHSRRHCALALTRQPVAHHGSTRLFVDCFGFDGGFCDANDIRMRFRGRVIGTGRTFRKVRLNHLGRRLLATHRRGLAVDLSATLRDDAGRSERRRGRAVVRSG
jgi:hypothetical protein